MTRLRPPTSSAPAKYAGRALSSTAMDFASSPSAAFASHSSPSASTPDSLPSTRSDHPRPASAPSQSNSNMDPNGRYGPFSPPDDFDSSMLPHLALAGRSDDTAVLDYSHEQPLPMFNDLNSAGTMFGNVDNYQQPEPRAAFHQFVSEFNDVQYVGTSAPFPQSTLAMADFPGFSDYQAHAPADFLSTVPASTYTDQQLTRASGGMMTHLPYPQSTVPMQTLPRQALTSKTSEESWVILPQSLSSGSSAGVASPEPSGHSMAVNVSDASAHPGHNFPYDVGRRRSRAQSKAGAGSTFKAKQKQRGKLSPETRDRACRMRRKKACLRCRFYKEPCDEGETCERCRKVINSGRSLWNVCFQDHLDDEKVAFARRGNGRFAQHQVEFFMYNFIAGLQNGCQLRVNWTIPGVQQPLQHALDFNCQRFQPTDSADELTIRWSSNGHQITIKSYPFAVENSNILQQTVNDFLNNSQSELEEAVLRTTAGDDIWDLTMREAIRYRNDHGSHLVNHALKICCATIASQGKGYVEEGSLLQMRDINFDAWRNPSQYEKYQNRPDLLIPLPLDHQIDVAILLHAAEAQRHLVELLKERIFNSRPKRKAWFEIFLTTFVVLSNLEYVHQGFQKFMASQRDTFAANSVRVVMERAIEQYEWSANNLLHHFGTVVKGFLPFVLGDKKWDEMKTVADLDDVSLKYVDDIRTHLRNPQSSNIHSYNAVNATTPHENNESGRWRDRLFRETSQK